MRRAFAHRSLLCLLVVVLAACARAPVRTGHADTAPAVPTSGLYAPEIADGGPPIPADISRIPEPVPQYEPLSRYGNRSPYTVLGQTYHVLPSADGYRERGIASWYGTKFHGRATSSLEPYDMYRFSAAHKALPLPSFARVTNLENGRSVIVRVNDRGPFHGDRLIDLSYAAAVKLGVHIKGTARVEVAAIDPGEGSSAPPSPAAASAPGSPLPIGTQAWLQVGSFAERDNARRVLQQLRSGGVDASRMVRVRVAGQRVWRVRAGPLKDESAERSLRERLRTLGFPYPQRVTR